MKIQDPARPAVLEQVRGLFVDNLVYKLVALAFAVTLWVWVQSEQVVQERIRVKLDWRLPEGFVLVEAPLPVATVTVEGIQAAIRGVRHNELTLHLDLTTAREGEANLDLTDRPIEGLPAGVQVVSIAPQGLQVRLDRVLRRRVPVVPATHGEVAAGYSVRSVTVAPDRVELSGPASVLRGLTEVQTDEVDLSALKEDAEFQVGLNVKKGQLVPTRPGDLTVSVKIAALLKQRTFANIPVVVRDDGTHAVDTGTATVTLEGPADKLDGMDLGELSVLVYVPDGAAAGDARSGKGAGLHYEVVQPGGDAVSVKDVSPAVIHVRQK